MNTFGTNKASDRKNFREMLLAHTLVGVFSALAGVSQKTDTGVEAAVKDLGFTGVCDLGIEVLRTQVSGSRGRPALEEQPIHAILKGLREASKVFTATESVEKAQKVLAKAVKEAAKAEERFVARRALFKPSARIQGAKRLAVLAPVPEPTPAPES